MDARLWAMVALAVFSAAAAATAYMLYRRTVQAAHRAQAAATDAARAHNVVRQILGER